MTLALLDSVFGNLHPLDVALIGAGFLMVVALGLRFSRRAQQAGDFFTGSRRIGWPLACFSLVATETSGITFIAIPAIAFAAGGNWTFLQMTLGYLAGRVLVAWLLVPQIRRGGFTSVYEYIGERMGPRAGALVACVFLVTRVCADGVRLFVTAIPLSLATGWSIEFSIALIVIITVWYSLMGGIRGIVTLDALQLAIYLAGAVAAVAVIAARIPGGLGPQLAQLAAEGRLRVFDFSWRFDTYTFWAGAIGGTAFSLASHGTDHLMAQRYLLVPTDADARKVLIASGVIVMLQFALFLFLGSCLAALWPGRSFPGTNEVFAAFIVEELPPGLRGLVLAGVFAAAMSTLSSTINALAASSLRDVGVGLLRLSPRRAEDMRLARRLSFAWGAALAAAAFSTSLLDQNAVELALGIAGATYGGILGVFLLCRFTRARGPAVAAAFVLAVGAGGTLLAARVFKLSPPVIGDAAGKILWPWYVPIGVLITIPCALALGAIPRLWRRGAGP